MARLLKYSSTILVEARDLDDEVARAAAAYVAAIEAAYFDPRDRRPTPFVDIAEHASTALAAALDEARR